jgi:hypothetical protein
MTASGWTTVIIVIVVVAGLVVFIGSVFHAERHPNPGRGSVPRRPIIGGIFRGDPRQQMPRRDAPAQVMTPDEDQGNDSDGIASS